MTSGERMPRKALVDPGWGGLDSYTFSPAIKMGDWLITSGMTSFRNGKVIGETLEEQLEVIFVKLGEILGAAGCDYDDIVLTREYITTKDGYRDTADVRARYFSPPYPAATGVIVADLVRPGALIELEAVVDARGV